MRHSKKIFGLALLCAVPVMLAAQVPVHINSGNPAFPFPQFLPYVHPNGDTLYNLGTHNADGVPHAELEQTIRDAYQIMMNRADYVTLNGVSRVGGANGTRYIAFHSVPRCSEGDGYAMLAAAMMADKLTFDGLWLHVHDFSMNKVTRYGDGGQNTPNYNYAPLPGVYAGAGDDSAADGDFDIALALMIAHMQWGDNMGINDSRGNPISYRDDFIKFIRAMTDTLTNNETLPERELLTGNIGFDGYFRGGNTWGEMTGWAASAANLASIGVMNTNRVYQPGGTGQYFDYNAPSYFRQFGDYLSRLDSARYAWNISQYRRGEASSDWLMGQLMGQSPRNIPLAGWVDLVSGGTPVFGNIGAAEDSRAPWRTIMNYMWHGNPVNSWDHVRHIVIPNTTNTYQRDAGRRYARFLWDTRQSPWNASCDRIIGEGLWWGPSMLKWSYRLDGSDPGTFPINWLHGSGSPSAVVSQDFNLMAEMYRQMEIEWDVDPKDPANEDRYLRSRPYYFHGFYRLLGMMILSGNHHAPLEMKRQANMKVYLDVDKTYASENDTITYTIDYRNYGAEDARNVVISNRLHNDMLFISATGGGTLDQSTNTVSWNIPVVPGYQSSMGANPTATMGQVSYKVVIPYANLKRYESQVRITCENGPGWVSNEFPNKISSIMKRNGVDIARRALLVDFSVFRDTVNPGMEATYTLRFENSTEAGWLNGGRPGVNFTYAHDGTQAGSQSHTFMLRAWNDAHEAYIDYGNYRISYFMNDPNRSGIGGNTGWHAPLDIFYPMNPPGLKERAESALINEMITPGQDERGRWNQRLILQISPEQTDTNWLTMAAPTQFLINYHGLTQRVHRGTAEPFKAVWRMYGGGGIGRNWEQDWSFNPNVVATIANDAMANWGFPVSPDFTGSYDPDYEGVPVTAVHRKLCEAPRPTIDNVLIEEWDGYTWRRVFGNGPLPGREVTNVVIRDTLPNGVRFKEFVGGRAPVFVFGTDTVTARIANNIITLEIPKLLVGQGGSIRYVVTADTPTVATDRRIRSRAWVSANRESQTYGEAILVVTRDSLPPLPPTPTTMYKTANKSTTYYPGDTITYTISYKQTHGFTAASTAANQWSSSTGINSDGTINLGATSVNSSFTQSLGTNVTLTGTIHPVAYPTPFTIYARESGANRVAVTFDLQWEGLLIRVTSDGQPIGSDIDAVNVDRYRTPPPNGPVVMDYKFVLHGDTLSMWVGDTAAYHPFSVITGIPVREGHSGVRYTSIGHGNQSITGWTTRSDLAFDVTIRDTIPFGLSLIPGSITGTHYYAAGTPSPRTLNATVTGNNVITWPIVSGNTPMRGNDSLHLTWRAIVDTARNNRIVNTAYAALRSYHPDSIGAQARSAFALEPIPPDTIIDPPDDTTLTGLVVRATPGGGLYAGSVSVTLSAAPTSAQGVQIWYTTNGAFPEPAFGARRYIPGEPLLFETTTTLRAIAYADGYDPADDITHVYEFLTAVAVDSAVLFDDVGDGLARGLRIYPSRRQGDIDSDAVRRQIVHGMVTFDGMPAINTNEITFHGDTLIVIRFTGDGMSFNPDAMPNLTVRSPNLNSPNFPTVNGYLAPTTTLRIRDGVAPVIVEAIYFPKVSENKSTPTADDTIAVTFSKYVRFRTVTDGANAVPFVFSRGGSTYELDLSFARYDGLTVYFAVLDLHWTGGNRVDVPMEGDLVRIKVGDDEIANMNGYPQRNVGNTAVPLQFNYPDLEYIIRIGPSPFRAPGDSLRIAISMEPFLRSAYEAMNPDVKIFDRMGNIVAATSGRNSRLKIERRESARDYVLYWNGTNRMGRRVGTGTYLVHITITSQDGNPKTYRRKVYLRGGK